MFRSKTVFIVGAGASNEVGLPVGAGLKSDISHKIDIRFEDGWNQSSGDAKIMEIFRRHSKSAEKYSGDVNDYLHACWQIRDAMPQSISIDNYIDAHRGNKMIEFCGKLGIVKCILEAERSSKLYLDNRQTQDLDLSRSSGTWYVGFFQLLTEGVSVDDVDSIFDNVSFVVFNYDRCIEQYLFSALKNYYSLTDEKTKAVLSRLKIHRPYGSVGAVAIPSAGVQGVLFGASSVNLLETAAQIKTFTEQIEDIKSLNEMAETMKQASTLVFLGFAFHPQNMELLKAGAETSKRVFATAFGISKSDCEVIESDIQEIIGLPIEQIKIILRNDLKCSGLFAEYRRSLTG
jgi:hypothetical protein